MYLDEPFYMTGALLFGLSIHRLPLVPYFDCAMRLTVFHLGSYEARGPACSVFRYQGACKYGLAGRE